MLNEVTVTYEGALHAEAELPDGSSLAINAPGCYGGSGEGPSPKDLFAAGYASCVAMTMDMAGKRNGLNIAGARFVVSAVWAEDKPLLTEINATVVLPEKFTEEQLDVLLKGAHMCPIHNSLRPEVKTRLTFEVA
ncbi:MAG: OsmC family protein [Planctomycetota bacterium]|jgi:uncharacterized OsmC-like protein